ncbi:MAG: ABC transporter ATP-binding protein [Atopobium sp.]|uniref:ABC transporter ATP-binding protein n=1 Tax=Atopobium sp. TaxID=1872650 RepID=UPI002A7506CE|nr:ABC transporter ATP-binding protein [Atopobium sp.]MDY2788373.1 ABC transporter ATP-binding protein [Atopobium sp.]
MVEIKNLTISYGKEAACSSILKDISLTIHDGECAVFTGKSGSGKTSLINAINGLGPRYDGAHVDGDILVDGQKIHTLEVFEIAQLISNVFQNPKTHFFNVDTTLELLFYLENTGVSRAEMERRLKDMLTLFPIEHLLDRNIFQLSGGEKQILCVASCYIAGTGIILLDEPSSNLDAQYIDLFHNMLVLLKERGVSLILSEHRLYYLMDIVDRFFVVTHSSVTEYCVQDVLAWSGEQRGALGLRDVKKTALAVPMIQTKESCPHQTDGSLYLQSLSVDFPGQSAGLRVEHTTFEMGNIYGIIGRNGCGKSSFVRAMIGVNAYAHGEIFLGTKKLSAKKRLAASSLVMQDVNHQLFSEDVQSEVCLGMKEYDLQARDQLLKDLSLYELRERHPFSLSGGQKQRVVIAATLFKGSRFIYFDEPTSGMDYENMLSVSRLIKAVSQKNNIVFIVSHDVEFLNETVDAVIDLEHCRA